MSVINSDLQVIPILQHKETTTMQIHDLNYLETADTNVSGGFFDWTFSNFDFNFAPFPINDYVPAPFAEIITEESSAIFIQGSAVLGEIIETTVIAVSSSPSLQAWLPIASGFLSTLEGFF
jgi:hypothetical protein